MVSPYETMYPDLNVPRYVTQLFPSLILIAVIENLIRLIRGKSLLRVNDSIASLSSGIFQDCFRLNVRSIELLCYILVFEHYRITTLPWNSIYTWMLCFLLVDLGFYWAHRLAHEVNFIWAIHQAHHSGEDFTIVTALRQALLQPFTAWMTYIPLALIGIPPQIFLAHLQLTEMYMIWIHTEAVQSLGPLEWILNSPSHHRVHHGRNRKYIDKNYGGALIIWDRLFATFEAEDPNEPVVYGLVHPVESYNIFYLQFHSWMTMYENIKQIEGWRNKLLVPFKGPGWSPGKPRLGYYDEIPELKHPVVYWNPPIHLLKKVYVIWHFAIVLTFYHELSIRNDQLSYLTLLISITIVLVSLTSLGFILEDKRYATQFEMIRCLAYFMVEQTLTPFTESATMDKPDRYYTLLAIRLSFMSSFIICVLSEFYRISLKVADYIRFELKHKLL
ncbi:hypothetical protein RDWZM_003440 [Blomia tropicalis]|uniref:Alkylglycerol monooxygenase n=1 Tax=Blomia tropicalis TaxID=40697 RepID=A0A9Q0MFA4_BLOTA|nr:hypothetical protein RDWZM_003440 [Blomia tropicalis]